jgi:hypothetical protein
MTDSQLYILVAIPLIGILGNTTLFIHCGTRLDKLSERFDTKFDLLMGKVVEIDNRLVRLEERLGVK